MWTRDWRVCQASFNILGTLFLLVGILGVVLPLLPATPFLLLASACYVRGSQTLYRWLMSHKYLGTYITTLKEYRGMPLQAKIMTIAVLWVFTALLSLPSRFIARGCDIAHGGDRCDGADCAAQDGGVTLRAGPPIVLTGQAHFPSAMVLMRWSAGVQSSACHCAARHCVAWRGACLDLDLRDAFLVRPICLAACEEIEVPTWHIRPTVINLHLDGLARFQIGHGGLRPKRRPMGSGQGVLIERLAARCFSAMETRSIPGGRPDLGGCRFAVGSSFFCLGDRRGSDLLVCVGTDGSGTGSCFGLHPARHSNVTPTMHPHASGVCTRDMVDSSSVTLVQGARLMPCRS